MFFPIPGIDLLFLARAAGSLVHTPTGLSQQYLFTMPGTDRGVLYELASMCNVHLNNTTQHRDSMAMSQAYILFFNFSERECGSW
jgi:hypothetical protein